MTAALELLAAGRALPWTDSPAPPTTRDFKQRSPKWHTKMPQGTPHLQLVDGIKPFSLRLQVRTAKYQLYDCSLVPCAVCRNIISIETETATFLLLTTHPIPLPQSRVTVFNTMIKHIFWAGPTNTSLLCYTAHRYVAEVESGSNLGERGWMSALTDYFFNWL